MEQPQRHVTSETGHDLGQLGHLVGRGRVQLLPGVHLCAEVRVLLNDGTKIKSEVLDVETVRGHKGRLT